MTLASALETHHVETLFGRRRIIHELKSPDPQVLGYGKRIAINTPIQGSAADLCKIVMNEINAALLGELSHTRGRLVMQIHDELVLECCESHTEEVAELVRSSMEDDRGLGLLLKTEIGCGKNWLAAKG